VVGKNAFGAALSIGLFISCVYVSNAQSIPQEGDGAALPGSIDCTKVEIEYADDPSLTREEKIALMDNALLRSLSKFDACKTSQADDSSGGSSGSVASEGAASGGGSMASSDMSGTEKQTVTPPLGDAAGDIGSSGNAGGAINGDSGLPQEATQTPDNGKIPEDIPSADNDSVLEAQIRQAAMNEKDPEIRAKLWDEYRKYKGKSQVE